MFSSFVKKTNKFNKCADRVLLISEYSIYKLDTTKFKSMKKAMPIEDVSMKIIVAFCNFITVSTFCETWKNQGFKPILEKIRVREF